VLFKQSHEVGRDTPRISQIGQKLSVAQLSRHWRRVARRRKLRTAISAFLHAATQAPARKNVLQHVATSSGKSQNNLPVKTPMALRPDDGRSVKAGCGSRSNLIEASVDQKMGSNAHLEMRAPGNRA
jgi:hypothetical protein